MGMGMEMDGSAQREQGRSMEGRGREGGREGGRRGEGGGHAYMKQLDWNDHPSGVGTQKPYVTAHMQVSSTTLYKQVRGLGREPWILRQLPLQSAQPSLHVDNYP